MLSALALVSFINCFHVISSVVEATWERQPPANPLFVAMMNLPAIPDVPVYCLHITGIAWENAPSTEEYSKMMTEYTGMHMQDAQGKLYKDASFKLWHAPIAQMARFYVTGADNQQKWITLSWIYP